MQVMLSVQSRAFKDCLEIFVAKYDKENAELRKTISEMERSLEFKDKLHEDLIKSVRAIECTMKDEREAHAKTIGELQDEVKALTDKLSDCESRLNYQDDQSRRNNIRISGLPEDANETWEMTQQKVAAKE